MPHDMETKQMHMQLLHRSHMIAETFFTELTLGQLS